MSPRKPISFQDIFGRGGKEAFVGRQEHLERFRQNLVRFLNGDADCQLIFSIFGQGGVGKTWLLRRFRQLAEAEGVITALAEGTEEDVPAVMGRITEQLQRQGWPLKTFNERYKVYRQRRLELDMDPDAPRGFSASLPRVLAKSSVLLGRRIPVGGAVFDLVDEDAFARHVNEWATYVNRKLKGEEARLVREPVEVLTPLFVEDLWQVAENNFMAFFFDIYERSREYLDGWLRDLLKGRYSNAPAIVLAIAGHYELKRSDWEPYERWLARLSLEPFTEAEAREYLAGEGITDERIIEEILRLSGRLPLLVTILAAQSPSDPDQIGDPAGTAVERFLKWVDDSQLRQVALDAALPRRLNRDVVAVLAGEKDADAFFAWLQGMNFVEERTGGWFYHDLVREQMLRLKHRRSPRGWAELHGRLATYYEEFQDNLGLDEKVGRRDATWQGYALEVLYHRLCQAPYSQLSEALNGFLAALKAQRSFAHRWAETILHTGTSCAFLKV